MHISIVKYCDKISSPAPAILGGERPLACVLCHKQPVGRHLAYEADNQDKFISQSLASLIFKFKRTLRVLC